MKDKTKLKVIQILCIISVLITVFAIQRTYARYFEQVYTTYATNIKKWVINVNNFIIHEQTSLNQVMQPIFEEDENINSNILVPGREGYFEMLIDYSNVDVAFEYEFTGSQLNENPLTDFEIYGYEVDGTPTVTETSEIKGVIDPSKDIDSNGEKKKTIKILFRWKDGEDNTMDNLADTQFSGDINTAETADGLHTVLNYKATVKFKQYIEPAKI